MSERLAEALEHHRAGRLAEAEQIYEDVLRAEPENADAWQFLGLVALKRGDIAGAVGRIERAIALNPMAGVYRFNLGLARRRRGDVPGAIASYRDAIRLSPDLAEAHNNLGNCLRESGDAAGAVAACREAITLRPSYADAHVNLGVALQEQGQIDDAIACYRHALTIKPDFSEAYYNLGLALLQRGRLDEVLVAFRRAIDLRPTYVDAWNNFGAALQIYGQFDAAGGAYRRAMELDPTGASTTAYRNTMGAMLHVGALDEAARWEIARGFETLYAAPVYARDVKSYANARDGERRVRVGYVSSDFHEHPVGRNLEPVFAHRDRSRFEVICYAEVARPDRMTARFQGLADGWRSTVGLSDEQVAAQVWADGVDILVVLAGRFDRNRPLVAAYRAAPVQVSFHDPGTSGLRVMDYLIADPVLVPRGTAERFSERVVRLPSFYVHAPLGEAPAVGELPASGAGHVTFGSFNNPAKVNAGVLDMWGEILRTVPGSRLKLKFKNWFANAGLRAQVLAGLGAAADRVDFGTEEAGRGGHLALYGGVDIALDPFPFTGSTTTFEALWMGVPVVTLLGANMAGRWSASMLRALKLEELVARSRDAYVALAVGLANDLPRLSALRAGLRSRVAGSPLCDGVGRARQVERLYRSMWQRWCAQAPHEVS